MNWQRHLLRNTNEGTGTVNNMAIPVLNAHGPYKTFDSDILKQIICSEGNN